MAPNADATAIVVVGEAATSRQRADAGGRFARFDLMEVSMRKFPVLGGVFLALVTATSAVAAAAPPVATSHPAASVPCVVVPNPAHKWTTAFTDGTVKVRATLRASSTYRGGSLTVKVAGVHRRDRVTFTLNQVTGDVVTPLMTRTMVIHTRMGHASATRGLTRTVLKALKALPTGSTLNLTVTVGATTATGTFAGK
jgi:hypothetical protein